MVKDEFSVQNSIPTTTVPPRTALMGWLIVLHYIRDMEPIHVQARKSSR